MIYRIADRAGEAFEVTVDHFDQTTRFRVNNAASWIPPIGHCNLCDSGDGTLHIMEIMIEEKLTFRNPSFVMRWFKPRVTVDYRGKGLGAALLECVIAHVRRTSGGHRLIVHRVHGFENNKIDLNAWYRRHGFAPGADGRLQMEFA